MLTKLFIVWGLAVVSFFALWALLAMVIRRVSERKGKQNNNN